MTVQELIDILKTCNPESVVHVSVEGGNGCGSYGDENVCVSEVSDLVVICGDENEDYCP